MVYRLHQLLQQPAYAGLHSLLVEYGCALIVADIDELQRISRAYYKEEQVINGSSGKES